jgi:hypothetical protein
MPQGHKCPLVSRTPAAPQPALRPVQTPLQSECRAHALHTRVWRGESERVTFRLVRASPFTGYTESLLVETLVTKRSVAHPAFSDRRFAVEVGATSGTRELFGSIRSMFHGLYPLFHFYGDSAKTHESHSREGGNSVFSSNSEPALARGRRYFTVLQEPLSSQNVPSLLRPIRALNNFVQATTNLAVIVR